MTRSAINKFFLIKFFISSIFSFFIYLSFRIDLIYKKDLKLIISFLIIIFIIWIIVFLKKKTISIIFYNLFLIIFFNFILTPIFHLITFDVPVRQPNYKITKEYKSDFFRGMFYGKHIISADKKGYRTDKKIDYENKEKNILRIFTIGASTTEEGATDDNKTWSSLLQKKLSKFTNKDVEVINTGMAGLRAEHHYITLKRIKKYEPDLVIFMMGINDWNRHVINNDIKYLYAKYEIRFDFKKSILFKTFKNINKLINRKLINKKKTNKLQNVNFVSAEFDTEAYLLPQIDSLNRREEIKRFRPINISDDYKYWVNLIEKECKKKDPVCLFLDQPTAYKKNISEKLKKRLWMTPPNENYTLNLNDLIFISSFYNNWIQAEINYNKLHFCSLSKKIEANTNFLIDDCHFSENGSKRVSDVLTSCINLSLKTILN